MLSIVHVFIFPAVHTGVLAASGTYNYLYLRGVYWTGRQWDIQLLVSARSVLDVHARNRPPVARVLYVLCDSRFNQFVCIQRFHYLTADSPVLLGAAAILELVPSFAVLEFIPLSFISGDVVLLQHSCHLQGRDVPFFSPPHLVLPSVCVLHNHPPPGVRAPPGNQGRHRSVTHVNENGMYFLNNFLRERL